MKYEELSPFFLFKLKKKTHGRNANENEKKFFCSESGMLAV